jgi:hypothetical protein
MRTSVTAQSPNRDTRCNGECPLLEVSALGQLWKRCAWGVHGMWITHRTKIFFYTERATLRERRRCELVFALSFA